MKSKIRTTVTIGIFIISSIVVINVLLVNTPVVIQIEGDAFKIVDIPYKYTINEAYLLLSSAFLCGFCLALILLDNGIFQTIPHEPESGENNPLENSQGLEKRDISGIILKALTGDERKTVEIILNKGGRILQNELVNSLDFSKAKVSRILINLEKRGIVKKSKYGLTNCISLADDIRGETK
ncbi:helix-turn-helix transcriptional regulator [Methanococcoides burtonii]|uniref:DUF7343 domain-containing protein n=1 Tax=Methanococcoides burtonii (strain DSM 6242 / NBRC 107633 / OCM 468 / ACE-M) TaxID=259564 RepID=Q12WQ4_METBU|nr:MarR family transcriptional regulator [Methanococcoides burtonii]ABE52122.1 Hypothetical protein Mbur_1199 [Methanococcoides burtonii DSM 6242]